MPVLNKKEIVLLAALIVLPIMAALFSPSFGRWCFPKPQVPPRQFVAADPATSEARLKRQEEIKTMVREMMDQEPGCQTATTKAVNVTDNSVSVSCWGSKGLQFRSKIDLGQYKRRPH